MATTKNMLEQVGLYTKILIAALEGSLEFANDEFDNLTLFLKSRLRSAMFEKPEKEKDVQKTESNLYLLVGIGKKVTIMIENLENLNFLEKSISLIS